MEELFYFYNQQHAYIAACTVHASNQRGLVKDGYDDEFSWLTIVAEPITSQC